MTRNRIYQCTDASGGATLVAPATSAEAYTCSQILIHNKSATLQEFIIYINEVQVYKYSIPAEQTFTVDGVITLYGASDAIQLSATTSDMTFTASGIYTNTDI